jgi:hypothetical protein
VGDVVDDEDKVQGRAKILDNNLRLEKKLRYRD